MVNFSYAVRVFKAELQSFLDPLVEGVSRPVAKLFFDLVYGVLRSGPTLVSMVARSVSPDGRIKTAECRLTDVDCSTKEGCRKALSCYRSRWRVEEVFRFMKVFYGAEGFMVRSLSAMNWVLLALLVAEEGGELMAHDLVHGRLDLEPYRLLYGVVDADFPLAFSIV